MRTSTLVAAGLATASGFTLNVPPPAAASAAASLQPFAANVMINRISRTRALLMMASGTELGDGMGSSTEGGTWFTTLDGRDEEGISPDGAIPPGEDLIEDDLRRLFDASSESDMLDATEMDDLKVCTLASP